MAIQAIEIAEFAGAPHYLGIDCRVHGQILVAQDRCDDALRSFARAIELFEKIGSRLELHRVQNQRAALHLAHGDTAQHDAARADIARARDAFAEMGAAPDRRRAERLLEP